MSESTFLTSIKSYFRCCCLKRDDASLHNDIGIGDQNNCTCDVLVFPDSPYILNTTMSNSSSSDWSLSSSSSSNDYNNDYRVFSTNIQKTVGRRVNTSVFDPFLTN